MKTLTTYKRPRNRFGNTRPGPPTRTQTLDSNGPDGRIRGSARQVYEKYLILTRDANAVGDRVAAENYSQHAEHYFRLLTRNGEGEDSTAAAATAVTGASSSSTCTSPADSQTDSATWNNGRVSGTPRRHRPSPHGTETRPPSPSYRGPDRSTL